MALAEMLGVTPLTAFYDYLPLLEAYDEGDDGDPVKPSWFDSTAGLRTIHALRDTIELDFTILDWSPDPSTKHWRRYLLDDLLACERVLKRAVTRKRKFRLMIVP